MVSLAWHPDGASIVVGGADSTLRKITMATGSCTLRITLDQYESRSTVVWDVAVMRDGTIVSADSTGKIQVSVTLYKSWVLHRGWGREALAPQSRNFSP